MRKFCQSLNCSLNPEAKTVLVDLSQNCHVLSCVFQRTFCTGRAHSSQCRPLSQSLASSQGSALPVLSVWVWFSRYQDITHSIHLARKQNLGLKSCDGNQELLNYLRSDLIEVATRLQKGGLGYVDVTPEYEAKVSERAKYWTRQVWGDIFCGRSSVFWSHQTGGAGSQFSYLSFKQLFQDYTAGGLRCRWVIMLELSVKFSCPVSIFFLNIYK